MKGIFNTSTNLLIRVIRDEDNYIVISPQRSVRTLTNEEYELTKTEKKYVDDNGLREATEEEIDVSQPLPTIVSPAQLRVWLIRNGIDLSNIESALNNIENLQERAEALARWQYSTEIRRYNPLVLSVGALLGMSESQIDNAFRAASKL